MIGERESSFSKNGSPIKEFGDDIKDWIPDRSPRFNLGTGMTNWGADKYVLA
jgi:hypothetical protein